MELTGIHHITAIASNPQANIDFYAGTLGLRLVKLTVNFDDPTTYHLYYGDGVGSPGTIMTFFPWPGAPRGRRGAGEVTASAFAIPVGAEEYWSERLAQQGVSMKRGSTRFGESVISISDPDGMQVELVSDANAVASRVYGDGPVPVAQAIRGLHSATLAVEGYEKTSQLLTETMGFKLIGQEGNRFRYAMGTHETASIVDVLCTPEQGRGAILAGSVHHIAFRTPGDEQQEKCLQELRRLGYNLSSIMDRKYFHSIYFREPGGILFEIATDPPGFSVDEALESIGTGLVLPTWLEPQRAELVAVLPKLKLPMRAAR